MEGQNFNPASIKANVSIVPTLSHAVLVTLILVAAISLIAGFCFLWYEKNTAWIPFSIFFFLIIIAGIGWWRSQKVIDMGNAYPTTVSDKNGYKIITDSRILEHPEAMANIGLLLQSMGVRQPLPEPDGIIDKNGKLLENSKAEAIKIANNINQDIQNKADTFMQKTIRGAVEVPQSTSLLPEESFVNILEHNQPAHEK